MKLDLSAKLRALEPLLLAILLARCLGEPDAAKRCPSEAGAARSDTQASEDCPGAALLQRGSHLKPLADMANEEAGTGHWQLDHDGIEWQGEGPFESLGSRDRSSGSFSAVSFISHASHTGRNQRHATAEDRAITFITVFDPLFMTNLGTSQLYLNRENLTHEWLLLDNGVAQTNISDLYVQAQRVAKHELLVFLHPDVILPAEWYQGFMQKLDLIEATDPNWGVLGTAGVPLAFGTEHGKLQPRVASCISDCLQIYTTGIDSLPVQSLDEALMILRRNTPLTFDAHLPGFDLYGMDIVMSARKLGMVSYLLNIPLRHKTVDKYGRPFFGAAFTKKVSEASYVAREQETMQYFQKKWCDSGTLPVYGTTFVATQPPLPCQ
jgi:hypothetical protein